MTAPKDIAHQKKSKTCIKVSLVIPTKNEAGNVTWVFSRIPDLIDEIIVVDSSYDNTLEVIRTIRKDVKIVKQEPGGKGAAIKAGFQNASGDIIVMMDADGSMDPQEIPKLTEPLYNGYDCSKGSRFLGGSEDLTTLRRFGNHLLCLVVNLLYGAAYTDLCYGFRAFQRKAMAKMTIESNGFDIEAEQSILIKKLNLHACEVPSYERKRISGKSNLSSFRDGFKILMRILKGKIRQFNR